jgi:hypothetical protein
VAGADDGPGGHAIFKWLGPNGGANPWVQMAGSYGVRVDAGNDGSAWVTTNTGAVWHLWGDPSAPSYASIGQPGTVATDITVGYGGNVFVVGGPAAGQPFAATDYPVYAYDAGINTFHQVPGAYGARLSAGLSPTSLTVVSSTGGVWTTERVLQH